MLYQFVQNNFISLTIAIYLLMFMAAGSLLQKKLNLKFARATVMSIILIIANQMQIWIEPYEYLRNLNSFLIAITYTLKPILITQILSIVLEDNQRITIFYVAISVAALNTVITLWALFKACIDSYSITDINCISQIICYILLAVVLYENCRKFKKQELHETVVQISINLIMAMAIVLQHIYTIESLANSGIIVAIMLHFLNCHTQNLKLDQLTGSYNLHTLYIDVDKYSARISGLISIDMNNLKEINDTLGHQAGDAAIVTMVNTIKEKLPSKCKLYRIGGDEFVIMCIDMWKPQVEAVMQDIEENMKTTNLIWSMGMAYKEDSFNAMLKKADAEMYEQKRRKKALM